MSTIEGTITLDDGETVQFRCSGEHSWIQWGNTTDILEKTVDMMEKIECSLQEVDGQ